MHRPPDIGKRTRSPEMVRSMGRGEGVMKKRIWEEEERGGH